jgi:hypothetical protein
VEMKSHSIESDGSMAGRMSLRKYLLACFGLSGLLLLSMIVWIHQISQLPDETASLADCKDLDVWIYCIVKERGVAGRTKFMSSLKSNGFRQERPFKWPSGMVETDYQRGLLRVSVRIEPGNPKTTARISRLTWTSFLPRW